MAENHDSDRTREWIWYLIVGSLVIWLFSSLTVIADSPRMYSPYSFTVVLPMFGVYSVVKNEGLAILVGGAVVPLAFSIWCHFFVKRRQRIPVSSLVLAIVLVVLSAAGLAASWSGGLKYQGAPHTLVMYGYNLAFWALMLCLYRRNTSKPALTSCMAFHTCLFSWLGWSAFPWLGERI